MHAPLPRLRTDYDVRIGRLRQNEGTTERGFAEEGPSLNGFPLHSVRT